MKTSHLIILAVLFGAWLTGCATTQEYTLYLQDVRVSGPVSHPPVRITNNKSEKPFTITPHLAINRSKDRTVVGEIDGHSPVGPDGRYHVDTVFNSNHTISFRESPNANGYTFTGQNLQWEMPDASFGIDVDYATSEHVALAAGASYSSIDGRGLWGYRVGIGFFSEDSNAAIRLDGGLGWQTLAYEARTVVVEKTTYMFSSEVDEHVGFFRDKGTSTPVDFYASLTFNTKRQNWFTNIFVQLAISKQSLASFKPVMQETIPLFPPFAPEVIVHDQRGKFSSTTFIITPGLYFDVAPSARVLAGAHIDVQAEIKGSTPNVLVWPLVELEWSL